MAWLDIGNGTGEWHGLAAKEPTRIVFHQLCTAIQERLCATLAGGLYGFFSASRLLYTGGHSHLTYGARRAALSQQPVDLGDGTAEIYPHYYRLPVNWYYTPIGTWVYLPIGSKVSEGYFQVVSTGVSSLIIDLAGQPCPDLGPKPSMMVPQYFTNPQQEAPTTQLPTAEDFFGLDQRITDTLILQMQTLISSMTIAINYATPFPKLGQGCLEWYNDDFSIKYRRIDEILDAGSYPAGSQWVRPTDGWIDIYHHGKCYADALIQIREALDLMVNYRVCTYGVPFNYAPIIVDQWDDFMMDQGGLYSGPRIYIDDLAHPETASFAYAWPNLRGTLRGGQDAFAADEPTNPVVMRTAAEIGEGRYRLMPFLDPMHGYYATTILWDEGTWWPPIQYGTHYSGIEATAYHSYSLNTETDLTYG